MFIEDSETQSPTEDRFRAILEQAPFSIQIMSADGRIVRVNRAWEELWGVTLDQIEGYNILEDEQLVENSVMPYIRRAFAGEAAEIPPVLYDPNATIPNITSRAEPQRWTKAVIYPIKDGAGRVREVVLMHEDITARMQAEEKMKASEARYRTLFETTLDGIMVVDEQGRYVEVNESLCRILKTPRERLIGSHFSEHMIPERLHDAEKAFTSLKEMGVFAGEFPMRAADGSVVELEWNSRAHFLPGLHVCFARDVTERKRTEEELHLNEARYRSLLENANDIIYSHDLEGNYLSINRAGAEITGYTRAEILGGLNIKDVVAPEHLERAKQMTARKLHDPTPTVYEVDIIARDGRRLTLEVSTRISYSDGQPVAVEGVARDVTERKRVEQERARLAAQVEDQRKHLQAMVSSVPGVVWEAWGEPDVANQRIDFVSDYVETMLGYSVEEWLSTPNFWLTIVHTEDKEQAAREAAKTFTSGKRGTNRFRWIAKDGRIVWVEAQSVAICDERGRPIGMRGVTMDISERKQKEANERFLAEASTALASSLDYETTLRTVARLAVPHFADWCSVDIANGNGSVSRLAVAHVNPEKVAWAHELQKRYPPDPAEPRGVYNVMRTGQSEFYPDIPDHLLVESARDEEHLEVIRQIGFRSCMLVPLKTRDNILGVLSFVNTDESRRHHTLEDLALAEDLANRAALAVDNARLYETEQRLRAQAEAANRIKDEFLATVSHELRTPLTSIIGWSTLLRTNKFDQEATATALETIQRNAKAQAQIIEDLLDVSRIITGKLSLDARSTELDSIIKIALEAIRPTAETKGLVIKSELEREAGMVWGDPARLQQVMWNLLANAVKFTPQGGEVEVRLRRVDSQVEISVSDTGQGISPEFLPYVFDRFRQADGSTTRAYGGLGLGLAIVRHLVEMHGGTVRAQSAGVGHGATFTAALPLTAAQSLHADSTLVPQSVAEAVPLDSPPALDDVRILIVDDEADARVLLTAIIEQCGAKVLAAASTSEALAALEQFKPHILVSDIGMPEEDGYTLIRKVRSLSPEEGGKIPAIALTAYAREEDRMRALLAGFQVHVAKPINPAELVAVVGGLARIRRPE